MSNKKLTIISVSLLSIFLIATFATLRQQAQNKSLNQAKQTDNFDLNELPIADLSQSSLAGETVERKAKNKRFNNEQLSVAKRMIKELPAGAEDALTISHWWRGLPALPVETSDAIVIGTVTNRAAYLSDDETNIYSEYEVKVEKIVKELNETLKSGHIVPFVRRGGGVRFYSGKIQKYQVSRYGTLKNNHRYLMFLKKSNGVDLFVVTGYEISGNKVIPIDGQDDKDPRSALPFDKYFNADTETLLRDVEIAIEASRSKEGTKQ